MKTLIEETTTTKMVNFIVLLKRPAHLRFSQVNKKKIVKETEEEKKK